MRRSYYLLTLAIASSACAGRPAPTAAQPPTVADADGPPATCKVAKDPLNPLIIEWPGTSKVALDSASQKGVVVVSYVGCVLKVLTSCQAGGSYDFKPVTPVRDKMSIESETELYARLPLGVASLEAELRTSGRLELQYVAVGQREAAKPPVSLSGECAGATHFVRTILVGAYGLDAVGKAKAGAEVEVAGRGGGAEHSESVRRIRGSGEVSKCAGGGASAKSDDCGAILQLGLAPLTVGGSGAVTAQGFGAGLGALVVVPTVQDFQTLPGGGQSLAAADVASLKALQEAKRADKGDAPAADKAAAWDKLAHFEGKNPYKELAERRREDWRRVTEAETRRLDQLAKVCIQHKADAAKLAKLLAYDDDVVTTAQKEGYKRELAQVYAPYKGDLAQCDEALEAAETRAVADAKRAAEAATDREAGAKREAEAAAERQFREARMRDAAQYMALMKRTPKVRMAALHGGKFKMGDRGDSVTVAPFELDVTEVTVDAYAACVRAGACSSDGLVCDALSNWGVSGRGTHPMNCVDWNQATAYCGAQGKRLPTEQEWEWAARGQEKATIYPWGNDEPGGQLCWGGEGGNPKIGDHTSTCPVGSYPRGDAPGGIHDLAGNVWEWTSSAYDGTSRVDRGGSWSWALAEFFHAAARVADKPADRSADLGFRCAR